MRFRQRMSKVRLFTIVCITLTLQLVSSQTNNGLRSLRFRMKSQSPMIPPTTPAPETPGNSTHQLFITTQPPLSNSVSSSTRNSTVTLSPEPRRRKVLVRRVKVGKRQGVPYQDETDPAPANNLHENGSREALYEQNPDDHYTPEHYYSPAQRKRLRGKQMRQYSKGLQQVRQQFHQSLQESQGPIRSRPTQMSYRQHSEEDVPTTQPPPKNYAFAYAVRDGDNTEDFSHKEARDGKLTMGEYRINLPDGRVQVVRYTAGGDSGYNADVTYEGEEHLPRNDELTKKPNFNSVSGGSTTTDIEGGYIPRDKINPPLTPKKYRKSNYEAFSPPYTTGQPEQYQREIVPLSSPKIKYPTPSYAHSDGNVRFGPGSSPPSFEDRGVAYAPAPHQQSPPQSPTSSSFGKYEPGPPVYFLPVPTPSQKPNYNRPSTSIRPEGYYPPSSSSPNHSGERRRKNQQTQRPVPFYEKVNYTPAEKKEYNGNLDFLHSESPRAGPRDKKKVKERGHYGGGDNDHDPFFTKDLHEEIHTIKKSHRPQFDYNQYNKVAEDAVGEDEKAAPLYNEPGPGNYYNSLNGAPPSSPTKSQHRKYSTPTPSPSPKFSYLPNRVPQPKSVDLPHKEDHRQSSFGGYTPINFKPKSKGLIPIDDFKAGPIKKQFQSKKPNKGVEQSSYYEDAPPASKPNRAKYSTLAQPPSPPSSTKYKEPFHYYNSLHPSYHHGGFTPPKPKPPAGIKQVALGGGGVGPTLPATSYTIDYPGGKHSFYLKTGPGSFQPGPTPTPTPTPFQHSPQDEPESKYHRSPTPYPQSQNQKQKPSQKSTSGLVYFETPGIGARPNELGVGDILSNLPNMPDSKGHYFSFPRTTIHPYEVGSKDYGNSVGYKNSFNTPSSGEKSSGDEGDQEDPNVQNNPNDHDGSNYSRDYLNNRRDLGISKSPRYTSNPNAKFLHEADPGTLVHIEQYHYQKAPPSSPSPYVERSPSLSPYLQLHPQDEPQGISYPGRVQSQPSPSPSPAISSTYYNQPLSHQNEYSLEVNNPQVGGDGGDNLISHEDERQTQEVNHPHSQQQHYQYEDVK